jgi:hypothetical protein
MLAMDRLDPSCSLAPANAPANALAMPLSLTASPASYKVINSVVKGAAKSPRGKSFMKEHALLEGFPLL